MSDSGKRIIGEIDSWDAMKGLSHVCSYILMHIASLDMNDQGESQWLNTLLVSVQNQDEDVMPDGGKRYVMGMIASIEYALRDALQKHREREQSGESDVEGIG